ncbi:MAG: Flp pilus assembly protein CpaB [Sphingorhabdus sp.]
MDRKKVILLVCALMIAAVTAFMARSMFAGGPAAPAAVAQQPVPTGPQIIVATRALPVGTIITADAFRYQPWPKELIEEAYFVKKDGGADATQELIGTVVRNPITAGQPVTKGSLVSPGDRGFLAAALGPGMRAVSVPVSALTGVAGFVFPGDRVDLVLTQNVAGTAGNNQAAGADFKVSETVIRNLRVLATDQRSTPEKDEKGNTVPSRYQLVTLEVTPRIAERIAVAQTIGTISLSLRSLAENAAELEQAIASGDVKLPKDATREDEERILSSIAQKPVAGLTTYSTGADVSRFQRGTPPATTPAQVAVEAIRVEKQIERVRRGATVRVSRAGAVEEVSVDRR